MRVFEKFNNENGEICPICKTSKEIETILVPIEGTESNNNIQAIQVHTDCIQSSISYNKDRDSIYINKYFDIISDN